MEVEASGDLMLQAPEGGVDVAGPRDGAVLLLAEEGGAGEDEGAFCGGRVGGVGVFPVLRDVAGVEKRKACWCSVRRCPCGAACLRRMASPAWGKYSLGFGAVEPEGVPALSVERADEIVPEEVAGTGVGGVVDVGAGYVEVEGFDLFEVGGVGVHEAPDGDHGVEVVLVEVA